MKFYTKQHKYYCGIDLHAKRMYVCVLDAEGKIRVHQNIRTNPEAFLSTIIPFREDIVVAVECMFTWYWIADLCVQQNIPFVLGHALYMKAIHGEKPKTIRSTPIRSPPCSEAACSLKPMSIPRRCAPPETSSDEETTS